LDNQVKNPPIAFGLILAVIYILASLGLSFTYATTQRVFPDNLILGFDLLGYISIVLLIYSGSNDLSNYHLEKFSLLLLIIFPGLFRPVPSRVPGWALLLFIIIPAGSAILIYLRVRQLEDFQDGKLPDLAKSLLLGTGIAILFFSLANVLGAANQITPEKLEQVNLSSFIHHLIASLSTNAAIEETLFRGFLLGYLINKRGVNLWLAITFQAFAFWLPHIYQANNPFVLQALNPVFGVAIGLVTFKTKNITSGIFAHAIYNALLAVF
jgi:membrane protease YdiL (CAAX protease family)